MGVVILPWHRSRPELPQGRTGKGKWTYRPKASSAESAAGQHQLPRETHGSCRHHCADGQNEGCDSQKGGAGRRRSNRFIPDPSLSAIRCSLTSRHVSLKNSSQSLELRSAGL